MCSGEDGIGCGGAAPPSRAMLRYQDQPTLCAVSWDNLVLSYPGYGTVS